MMLRRTACLAGLSDRVIDTAMHNCRLHTAAAEQLAANGHPRLKLYTLSCRLELYVQVDIWAALPRYMIAMCLPGTPQ